MSDDVTDGGIAIPPDLETIGLEIDHHERDGYFLTYCDPYTGIGSGRTAASALRDLVDDLLDPDRNQQTPALTKHARRLREFAESLPS